MPTINTTAGKIEPREIFSSIHYVYFYSSMSSKGQRKRRRNIPTELGATLDLPIYQREGRNDRVGLYLQYSPPQPVLQ